MAGCVSLPHVPPKGRSYQEQAATTVTLEVECGDIVRPSRMASGVILDERHVVTAYHAVKCAHIPFVRATYGGKPTIMVVVKEDPKSDLAMLELLAAENFKLYVPPPVIAQASPGDYACSSTGWPKTGWSCGKVAAVNSYQKGDLVFAAETRAGNSGSGLYNDRGELIGIMVEKVTCVGDKTDECTGTATSLFGKSDYYPK